MNEPRHYTKESLKRSAEKKLGRGLAAEQWDAVAPDWSGPYDDADLEEVLKALRESTASTEEWEEECSRLSWLLSRKLEDCHHKDPNRAALLDASGWRIRPLGDFYAWSWLYAHAREYRVLKLIDIDPHDPNREVILSPRTNFDNPLDRTPTLEVLGLWSFFWTAVEDVSKRFARPALDTVASLFWPATWGALNTINTSKPDFPGMDENKAEFLDRLAEGRDLKAPSLRRFLENRAWKLYREHSKIDHPVGTSDATKHCILLADCMPLETWQEKLNLYRKLAESMHFLKKPREIATRQQFAVEAKRLRREFPAAYERWQRRDDLLFEIGPRWHMDGQPLKRPGKQG